MRACGPRWRMTILTAITCYIFLAATFATADTSLCFNEKIIFQDALIGKEDFTPTDQMNTDMTKALNVAVGNNAALTTQVYNAFPHLAVVASFWTTGTDNTVNSNIATLEKAFEQWSSPATSNTLYQNLNPVTNTYVGQQGRTIAVSEGCGNYVAMGMNSYTCLRNLSVTILTQSQTTGLQAALCNALNLGSCNLIELLKQDTEVITTAGAITGISTVKTYQRYAFNIYVQNREVGLASLVTRARYASALSSQRIAFVRVNGVQVYQSSDQASETVIGSTGQCAEKMWYLIFLLITIPIFIIATHRFYMYGNRSGKRTIAKQEQEIRASIHIQAATHMQPQQHGAFFMNNYLRSVSGYQAPQSVAPAAELQWIQGTDGQWYQVPAAPAPAPVVQQPTPQWVQTADGQWYMEDPNARIESWRQSTA